MSEFKASLIPEGDPNPIDTTVEIRGSLLELWIGSESIGSWPIEELGVERILGGVRMNVDGERAVLKLDNPEPLLNALGMGEAPPKQKKSRRKRSKPERTQARSPTDVAQTPSPVTQSQPDSAPTAKLEKSRKERKAKEPKAAKVKPAVGRLDRALETMSAKWGGYIPDWLFSKGGLVIVVGVLLALVAKPRWFSVGLLILAAIGLAISAVAMVDQVVATRIFKGGYTPGKALVGSLVLGIIGILLGGFI